MHKNFVRGTFGGIGDVLMYWVIHALARSHPAAEISVGFAPGGGSSDPARLRGGLARADRDNRENQLKYWPSSRHSFDFDFVSITIATVLLR